MLLRFKRTRFGYVRAVALLTMGSVTAVVGAQSPSVEEIRQAQRRSFAKIQTVRAVIDRTFTDQSADWVKLDQDRRKEELGEPKSPPRSVALYEAKGLAWRASEAYVTKVGTADFKPLIPKDPRRFKEEIAKPRPKNEEVWLQVADYDGKDRYYSRYLSGDGKTSHSSVLFMRRGLMDRGPLAYGYLCAERPLSEMLEDGPVQRVTVDGRPRYRVKLRRPDQAENLTEAYATFDPEWGMVATQIDVQSEWNGLLMVERFTTRGMRNVEGVWLPKEGVWESRGFKDRKIVLGKTEVSRFLDLKVNDPSVDLSMNFPKKEWVTNRDTGQIFEVADDGTLRPRSWTKKRPTWVAMASGTSYLAGVGLLGVITCLGIVRLTRRRS